MTAWTWRDGQEAERSGASGLSGGFMPSIAVFAGEHANADIYPELLRQHVVPWVQRDVAWWKIRPSANSAPACAGLRRPDQLAAVAEFWFSVDWPPYSPNLNSLDFSSGSVLRPKGQATPHANFSALRPSVAAEWNLLVAVQIHKTCCSFCRRR